MAHLPEGKRSSAAVFPACLGKLFRAKDHVLPAKAAFSAGNRSGFANRISDRRIPRWYMRKSKRRRL
jgi:hypothetical protein